MVNRGVPQRLAMQATGHGPARSLIALAAVPKTPSPIRRETPVRTDARWLPADVPKSGDCGTRQPRPAARCATIRAMAPPRWPDEQVQRRVGPLLPVHLSDGGPLEIERTEQCLLLRTVILHFPFRPTWVAGVG
jgi:hypothetical protein